jgi:hypothetical protein
MIENFQNFGLEEKKDDKEEPDNFGEVDLDEFAGDDDDDEVDTDNFDDVDNF